MRVDVIMPQMGESIAEGTLTRWLKKPGEKVARDEPIFEISTDKVDAEIPAPAAGTPSEVKVNEGETGLSGRVTKKDVLAAVSEGGARGAAVPGGPPPAAARPAFAPGERVSIEPMSAMRRKIAEHMILSRRTSAHVTTVFEVDLHR